MNNGEVGTKASSSRRLRAKDLYLSYDGNTVVKDLSVDIPDNRITIILGPNACGKSTLLKALGRLLKPKSGNVLLDGKEIRSLPTKEVARTLGLLPQSPITPEGIKASDLIGRGRSPHQSVFQQWSKQDESAVLAAMYETDTSHLADRYMDDLSGGQRQRIWIAMALAQQTDLLLLDEPTTFLDIAHQIDVLELISDLNRSEGKTIIAVLHDLNLAARYADHIIAMRDGQIRYMGNPNEVICPEMVQQVFDLECLVIDDPVTGSPLVIPTQTRQSINDR